MIVNLAIREFCAVLLLVVLIFICGCNSATQPNLGAPQPGNESPFTVLPFPDSIRATASIDPAGCVGAAFDTERLAPNLVTVQGESALFSPTWDPDGTPVFGDLARALFVCDFSMIEGPQEISLAWEIPPAPEDCWLGLGNHELKKWEWFQGKSPEISDLTPYLNSARELYVLVALTGVTEAKLTRLDFFMPPVVIVTTTPPTASGDYPLSVSFDALDSYSPDSTIASFEWDYTGDGSFDDTGLDATGDYSYETPIECDAEVRVTDIRGVSRTRRARIFAQGIQIVYPGAGASSIKSREGSLAIIAGNPAIAYKNTDSNQLEYIRATDPFGNYWAAPVVVDSAPGSGTYVSLKVIDRQPAIAYAVGSGFDIVLKFVRALDTKGNAWGTPLVVDDSSGGTHYPELEVVGGNPAIGYYHKGAYDLRFVRATDAQGTNWGEPIIAVGGGVQGLYCSMEVVDGNPAMSYWKMSTDFDLYFVRATDALGTLWDTPQQLDTNTSGAPETSLCNLPKGPAISYHDGDTGALKFIAATNASGSTWGSPVTLVENDTGRYGCLMVIDGIPMVSYVDYAQDLHLIKALDADGVTWDYPTFLFDVDTQLFPFTSMVDVQGLPGIAFTADGDLTYVRTVF